MGIDRCATSWRWGGDDECQDKYQIFVAGIVYSDGRLLWLRRGWGSEGAEALTWFEKERDWGVVFGELNHLPRHINFDKLKAMTVTKPILA